MPYNKGNLHWITLRCVFPSTVEDCEEGYVYSIDYKNSTDDDKQTIAARLWFAKLMGVYFDILTKKQGYSGPNDIYLSYHESMQQYMINKETFYSLINNVHLNTEKVAVQTDNFNCGVITCLSCTKFSNGSQEWIVSQEEISLLKCTLWRERFCSFLDVMTKELNKVAGKVPFTMINDSTNENPAPVTQDSASKFAKETTESPPTKNTHLRSILPNTTSTISKPIPKNLEEVFSDKSHMDTPSSLLSNKIPRKKPITQTQEDEEKKPEALQNDAEKKPAALLPLPSSKKMKLLTPMKKKKSNSAYDKESMDKYLHAKSTKKERRIKYNAMTLEENKSKKSIGEGGLLRRSILTELAEILSDKIPVKQQNAMNFFKSEMEKYETFYVVDHEYEVPSNPSNAHLTPLVTAKRIMTVAIVEIADFGDWTYKHNSVIEENKVVLKRVLTGYTSKNKAIIIRYIATLSAFENHGYASYLLRWIAESYHGTAVYVFTMMSDPKKLGDEANKTDLNISGDEQKALQFLKRCTFTGDEEKERFSLSVVDPENKSQESITDKSNIVFRTTTAKMKNISQKYLYGTARFGKLDKSFVTKICYTKEMPGDELSDYLKTLTILVYDHDEKKAFAEDGVDYHSGKQKSNNRKDNKKDIENETNKNNTKDDNVTKSEEKAAKGTTKTGTEKESESKKQNDEQESSKESNDEDNAPNTNKTNDSQTETTTSAKDSDKSNKKELPKTTKKSTPKNPYRKVEKNMTFYGLNPHFGWLQFDNDNLATVDLSIMESVRNNPHKIVKIPGGYRDVVERKEVSIKNINTLPRIKRAFHLSSRNEKEIGTCQWMAAIMLIDTVNKNDSEKMMDFMKNYPEKVNWKPMYKGNESLAYYLRKISSYYLQKVRKNTSNYIPFLMECNEGLFVCVLTDNNYAEKHVVGIDCGSKPKLIWDSSEKQALELTQTNLDKSTGPNNFCIKIQTIGEIVAKEAKQGKKRPHPDSTVTK